MPSWVSAMAFETFINECLFKTSEKTLLQMDGAPGHCNAVNLKKISLSGRVISMGQGETSSKSQANDRLINQHIQKKLRQIQFEWLKKEVYAAHETGNIHKAIRNPSIHDITKWAHEAVSSVNRETVISSFKEVGLTIAVDGSDDTMIHSQLQDLLTLYKQNVVSDPSKWKNDDGYVPGAPTDTFLKQIRRRKDTSTFKGTAFVCSECSKSYANKYSKAAKEHAAACPFKTIETLQWEPKKRCNVLESAFVETSESSQ